MFLKCFEPWPMVRKIFYLETPHSHFFSLFQLKKKKVSRCSCYPSCEMHSDIFYSILGNSILFIQCWSWPTKLISWPIYGLHPTVWRTLFQLTQRWWGQRQEMGQCTVSIDKGSSSSSIDKGSNTKRNGWHSQNWHEGNWRREDKNVLVRWR